MLKTLIWGALLGAVIAICMPFFKNPTQTIPFPYFFAPDSYKTQNPESPILIMGDRMGKRFYEYAETMSQEISKGLVEPIQIQSWAKDGDGLHRILKKLQSLKKIPKIVIFHGMSQEFLELRFKLNELENIGRNFDIYQDQTVRTMIYFFPVISRYLYQPVKRLEFTDKIIPFLPTSETKRELIEIQSMTYKIIEHELDEIINIIQKNGSTLMFVTTPINYKIKPQRACSATISSDIKEQINSAEDYIQRGMLKEGLLGLNQDSLKSIPNPFLFFLRAKVHHNLLEYTQSMENYQMAASFDCKLWRTTPILNNIMRTKAAQKSVSMFDFAQMIEDDFFINDTFIDELYPQDFYYERMAKAVGQEVKKLLGLQ